MMTKYYVHIEYHGEETIEIEAENAEEAWDSINHSVMDLDFPADDLENGKWIVHQATTKPTVRIVRKGKSE